MREHVAVLLLTLIATLSGCGSDQATSVVADDSAQAVGSHPVPAIRLVYEEQEPGTQPFSTRYLITADYLRIDDGADSVDFILLDRRTQTIYSTNGEDETILAILYRAREAAPPVALDLAERQEPLQGAPTIARRHAEHRVYLVNDKRCYDVVAVPGLAEDAVAALRLYRRVLASEHRRLLPHVPAETHEACDLAHNVFAADRHLQHGLPIQEWDQAGYRRALLDIDADYRAEAALFKLPEGFRRFAMEVDSGDGA